MSWRGSCRSCSTFRSCSLWSWVGGPSAQPAGRACGSSSTMTPCDNLEGPPHTLRVQTLRPSRHAGSSSDIVHSSPTSAHGAHPGLRLTARLGGGLSLEGANPSSASPVVASPAAAVTIASAATEAAPQLGSAGSSEASAITFSDNQRRWQNHEPEA
mmetsp:Transcript_145566/g.369318  ORF Transcript_145566/g.369318 Transcript_145566/m.369318 type:complete len:157 (+) Transcript_145566:102-572(+)